MSKKKPRKRKEKRHSHWVSSDVPPLRTVVHATKVTIPAASRDSYERMWATPLMADLRARAEAEGLNPLAVLNVVFEHVGAGKGHPSPMGVELIGAPADIARVQVLGEQIWRESPNGR